MGPILLVPHISSHHFLSSYLCPFWFSTTKSFPRLTPAIQILYVSQSHFSDATCEARSICSESLSWNHVRRLFISLDIFLIALEATMRDGATMLYLPPTPRARSCVGKARGGTQEVATEDTRQVWLLNTVNPDGDGRRWWQVAVDRRALSWRRAL